MLASHFKKKSGPVTESSGPVDVGAFAFAFDEEIDKKQKELDDELCKDDEAVDNKGNASSSSKKKKKKKKKNASAGQATSTNDVTQEDKDSEDSVVKADVLPTAQQQQSKTKVVDSSANKQQEKSKGKKKGKGGQNSKDNNVGEDDDDDWYDPQPQPKAVKNKELPSKKAQTKGNGEKPSVLYNKQSVGSGKNIVAIGQPKYRDPSWLDRPPGLPERTDESVNVVGSISRTPGKGRKEKKDEKKDEAVMHSNPFSFGFGL